MDTIKNNKHGNNKNMKIKNVKEKLYKIAEKDRKKLITEKDIEFFKSLGINIKDN